ncbi:PREDICTED: contactin-4-like, partial [Nicrophorus vespilloides]|uniref:Contactin-4-like n=1 Tax=Nicrophorus vespilloides TaxID=110193 RepID=A0ABM1N039_NICVS
MQISNSLVSSVVLLNMKQLYLLITFVFTVVAQNLRRSDITSLPVESMLLQAGDNITVSCPGVNEQSLVLALEWFSVSNNQKLIEFASDTITVWADQDRISLLRDTYGLDFHPIAAEDSGDYVCLVNNRPKAEALVRLIVQGVPDPPGRPLIMSFTSRSVNLSWAPSQDIHHSLIKNYVIHVR